MISRDIPFQEIGINKEIGKSVIDAINQVMSRYPEREIKLDEISNMVGFPGTLVKQIFFLLLSFRQLKATFLPLHRHCGNVVGKEEHSVDDINIKAEKGEYGEWCCFCHEPINGSKDIETQIIFWEPGKHVK